MTRNYEDLVNEYARVRGTKEHIRVLKQFESEVYKRNKVHIDNELERLEVESERLLTELEKLINIEEPV